MSGSCRRKDCPSDLSCADGEVDKRQCPNWTAPSDEPAPTASEPRGTGQDLPWNAYTLGLQDLGRLLVRSPTAIIGLIGAPDAGKTTFLIHLYLHLLRGRPLAGRTFAGSLTLGAWESLAAHCRWAEGRPATFPPHTTSNARVPGLLHVALRDGDSVLRDVVFTDAPGEWFTRWATRLDDVEAEGARWIARHADGFLLFADSAALSDMRRLGAARKALLDLLPRVGGAAGDRPVMFLWAKADQELRPELRRAIEQARERWLPSATVRAARVDRPLSLLDAASELLSQALRPRTGPPLVEPAAATTPFLAFRGHHAAR